MPRTDPEAMLGAALEFAVVNNVVVATANLPRTWSTWMACFPQELFDTFELRGLLFKLEVPKSGAILDVHGMFLHEPMSSYSLSAAHDDSHESPTKRVCVAAPPVHDAREATQRRVLEVLCVPPDATTLLSVAKGIGHPWPVELTGDFARPEPAPPKLRKPVPPGFESTAPGLSMNINDFFLRWLTFFFSFSEKFLTMERAEPRFAFVGSTIAPHLLGLFQPTDMLVKWRADLLTALSNPDWTASLTLLRYPTALTATPDGMLAYLRTRPSVVFSPQTKTTYVLVMLKTCLGAKKFKTLCESLELRRFMDAAAAAAAAQAKFKTILTNLITIVTHGAGECVFFFFF
jgi:hypothetical protein